MKNLHNIGHNPRSSATSQDKPQTIRQWQARFENHLLEAGQKATRSRYSRALERFIAKNVHLTYPHEITRPLIMDFVEARIEEGAAIRTLRVELAALRSFWAFLEEHDADIFCNPVKNLKIPRQYLSRSKKCDPQCEAETSAPTGY